MSDSIGFIEVIGISHLSQPLFSLTTVIKVADRVLSATEDYTDFTHVLLAQYCTEGDLVTVYDLSKSNGADCQQVILRFPCWVIVNDGKRLLSDLDDYVSFYYPHFTGFDVIKSVPLKTKHKDALFYFETSALSVIPTVTSDYLQWFYNRIRRQGNEPCNTCVALVVKFLRDVLNHKRFRYTMTPSELVYTLKTFF